MNPESHDDWIDEVASRRLTQRERELRREALGGRPAEQRRLERELALNDLLDAHRPAPKVSSNFAARVLAEATRGPSPRASHWGWLERLRWMVSPRFAAVGVMALAVGIGFWNLNTRQQSRLAAGGIAVAHATAGLDPKAFADFEAVRHLATTAKPDDDALIVALAQ